MSVAEETKQLWSNLTKVKELFKEEGGSYLNRKKLKLFSKTLAIYKTEERWSFVENCQSGGQIIYNKWEI